MRRDLHIRETLLVALGLALVALICVMFSFKEIRALEIQAQHPTATDPVIAAQIYEKCLGAAGGTYSVSVVMDSCQKTAYRLSQRPLKEVSTEPAVTP